MVDQKLVDFIRKMLKDGVSLDAIKSQLKQKGWPENEITRAVDSAIPAETPAPKTYCWKCGAESEHTAKLCKNCGVDLSAIPDGKSEEAEKTNQFCLMCKHELVKVGEFIRCPTCDTFCDKCGELMFPGDLTCPKCQTNLSKEKLQTRGIALFGSGGLWGAGAIIFGVIIFFLFRWGIKFYGEKTGLMSIFDALDFLLYIGVIIGLLLALVVCWAQYSIKMITLYSIMKRTGIEKIEGLVGGKVQTVSFEQMKTQLFSVICFGILIVVGFFWMLWKAGII
ncbi:hypothetical protein FJZ53_02175 [Candidatus Woesearchaeota archaeon]|nr:hypothetical protein [Candidatus Woesearchaeota archaeon]